MQIPFKTKEQLQAEQADKDRQHRIHQLESLLDERYQAHSRLLATDAVPSEIDEVKGEIASILAELGGLYNATTT